MSAVGEKREVQTQDAKAALEELRSIARVEGEAVLRPFIDAHPGFFATLAERLRESKRRHSEIAGVDIVGEVDPEEGYPLVGVELVMSASPERAHGIMNALLDEWVHEMDLEAPLELEVMAKPT